MLSRHQRLRRVPLAPLRCPLNQNVDMFDVPFEILGRLATSKQTED